MALFLLAGCGGVDSSAMMDTSDPTTTDGKDDSAGHHVRWCNTDHTADDYEGDFPIGGVSCGDSEARTKCYSFGGTWCKGYVDVKDLLCVCADLSAH
jgi:hypothetical protein